MRTVSLLAVLALAPACLAQPPVVPSRLEAAAGKPKLFDVQVPAAGMGWAQGYDESKCPVVRLYSDDPKVAKFMAIPDESGEFHLIFWTVGEKGHSRLVISVGGKPTPDPIPPPKPKPTPDPDVVKASKVSVVVIEESSKRTPAQAATMNDPALRKWLTESGSEIDIVDKDDPAAKAAGYSAYFEKYGHVTVLVFDKGATGPSVPLSAFKLTSSPAELRAAIAKVLK